MYFLAILKEKEIVLEFHEVSRIYFIIKMLRAKRTGNFFFLIFFFLPFPPSIKYSKAEVR